MKWSHGSRPQVQSALPLACLLLLGLLGCGDGEDNLPFVMKGDGGPPSRTVSDADFRDPVIDAAEPDPDAVADDASVRDGSADGADAASSLKIEINIASPMANGVVAALVKFTPEVDVVVYSPSGGAGDTLKDLSAEVVERITRKVVATAKLNQIGFHAVPETTALVYNFAETPIDLAATASGNYDLVVTALTNAGAEWKATQPVSDRRGPASSTSSRRSRTSPTRARRRST